jgi:hypothetical protein
MPRRFIFMLAIVVVFAMARPGRAATIDTLRLQRIINTLMDPHAASWEKAEACIALADAGPEALPAVPALVRQSRYDMPNVRARAMEALQHLVGSKVAADLRAADPGGRGKADVEMARLLLQQPEPATHRRAATDILVYWNAKHELPAFSEAERGDLAAALSELSPNLSDEGLKSAVTLLDALGGPRNQATGLLIRALAWGDKDTRDLAQQLADGAFAPDVKMLEAVNEYVRALSLPRTDDAIVAQVVKRIVDLGPEAKSVAIDLACFHIALGDAGPRALLERLGVDETPAAKAAAQVGKLAPGQRPRVAILFHPRYRKAKFSVFLALGALTDDDRVVRQTAADVIAIDKEHFDRNAIVLSHIAAGKVLDEETFHVLAPDPAVLCREMPQYLKDQPMPVRLAACRALQASGLARPEIRPNLEPLLDDPEDDVRYAAAALLDRKDILARAGIPALLADLRDESPTRRTLAARQLDELAVEPKQLTAALIRAVDQRNMPVRQGLILALDRAYASRQNTLEVLKTLAASDADPTTRLYARAALREIAKN